MRKPLAPTLLAAFALAVTGGAAAPAVAGTPSIDTADAVVASADQATTAAEHRAVTSYWTPERMEAAIPADVRMSPDGDVTTGAAPTAAADDMVAQADPENPQSELGKVFFTLGGQDYVCSGTATTSQNSSVVTTAGHCVHEGAGGSFATNFTFVPAYENGSAPHGEWSAATLYTSSGWADSGDFTVDVGFAVMNDSGGQSLTDAVGSYPIAFDQSRGLSYTSFGYPAGSPFDGQLLYSCSATAHDDPQGSTTQGIACDMTGGSSGGGWITGGQLNSVNSYKYTNDSSTMYGPYFGSAAQAVYDAAATS